MRPVLLGILAAEIGYGIWQASGISAIEDLRIQVKRETTLLDRGVRGAGARNIWGIRFEDGGLELYREEEKPVIEPY